MQSSLTWSPRSRVVYIVGTYIVIWLALWYSAKIFDVWVALVCGFCLRGFVFARLQTGAYSAKYLVNSLRSFSLTNTTLAKLPLVWSASKRISLRTLPSQLYRAQRLVG